VSCYDVHLRRKFKECIISYQIEKFKRPCSFPGCDSEWAMYAGFRCTHHKLTPEEREAWRRKDQVELTCERCGKLFWYQKCLKDRKKYCSMQCKIPKKAAVECGYCKKPFEIAQSKIKIGRGKHCSLKCFYDDINYIGEKNPNYHGIKKSLDRMRKCKTGREWRVKVLAGRETCELCGTKSHLYAHHIIPLLRLFLERRIDKPDLDPNDIFFHDVINGLAVCQLCHSKLHPKISVLRKGLK